MELNNFKHLKAFRKQLRNQSTIAECILWKHLKNKKLCDRKFRRQHSFGNYIFDFYCPKENLAIELDGGIHEDLSIEQYDLQRTDFAQDFNITIIRFDNDLIFQNIEGVLEEIKRNFK